MLHDVNNVFFFFITSTKPHVINQFLLFSCFHYLMFINKNPTSTGIRMNRSQIDHDASWINCLFPSFQFSFPPTDNTHNPLNPKLQTQKGNIASCCWKMDIYWLTVFFFFFLISCRGFYLFIFFKNLRSLGLNIVI